MIRFKQTMLAGFSLLALSACATTAATTGETRPSAQAAAATVVPAIQAPAMWVVRDADTTIWLFGTVHGLPKDLVWHQDQLRAAFNASDTLVKELPGLPDPQQMAGLMFPAGLDLEGPPLADRIGAERAAKMKAALTGIGLPEPLVDRMRPWLGGLMLAAAMMQKSGLDPEAGVEKILLSWAASASKPIEGLETAEQQIGFFRDLPPDVALAFLNDGIDEWEKAEAEMAKMVQAWKVGDLATLNEVTNSGFETMPRVREVLLGERNQRWAKWIDARMDRPGTVLVAVGAGHLVGADSVQVYLTREGQTAVRVLATAQ